ncbi:MAG: hypothetical protein ACRCT8_01455 [Lacipirellulaceae bacterium]
MRRAPHSVTRRASQLSSWPALLVCGVAAFAPLTAAAQCACESCSPRAASDGAGCDDGCQVCSADGLRGPWDEYLCDGGDGAPRAHTVTDGALRGLEQEDTVATYQTRQGETLVTPSSRVCIYAPRFASVRQVVQPMGAEQRMFVDALGDTFTPALAADRQPPSTGLQNIALHERVLPLPPGLLLDREQPGAAIRLQQTADAIGLVGPYANLSILSVGQYINAEKAVIANHSIAAITWTGEQAVQVTLSSQMASAVYLPTQPGVLYGTLEPSSPRLRLVKLASTDSAHPGDEVEFALRYDNVGDTQIDAVTITDNLTTRLEYVEGSAKSTREADFASSRSASGSLVLRWELKAPLKPKDGGVLTFKARVL